MMINASFTPSGPVAGAFLHDGARRSLILGPLGSGKTMTCAWRLLRHICAQVPDHEGVRRSRWFVVRTNFVDLRASALQDWLYLVNDIFKGQLGRMTWAPPPTYSLNFKLTDGSRVVAEVIFRGLDDPDGADKIRGANITGAWINEFREIPFTIVTTLFGRCGRFPRIEDGGATWSGLIGDSNMPDSRHWIYRLAEKEKPEGWRFFKQPGGVMRVDGDKFTLNPEAENLRNLPPNYYTDQMSGAPVDWIGVYLAAEYGFVRSGKPVYPEYADTIHCAVEDLQPVPGLPVDIGIDFGGTPAATFGQELPNGRTIILREIVTEQGDATLLAQLIKREMARHFPGCPLGRVTGDPAGNQRAQTDSATPFMILRNNGVAALPAETNDWEVRRSAVAQKLARLIEGKPALMISPACQVLRQGLAGGYAYRRIQVEGEARYADAPDKNGFSHVAEALQYQMLGAGEGRRVLRGHRPAAVPVIASMDFKTL